MNLETTESDLNELREAYQSLRSSLNRSFFSQGEVTELLLLCMFAGGHALLEGAPGLGKTTLVSSLARSLALDFRRIQFTPDLMPPDILGTRILEEDESGSRCFRFEQGPVFCNVLLADEINRGTPRTQSALLEAMQEQQVTVYGETRSLAEPFIVIATQNPIEMEGTYPLPEAQLDRFLFKLELKMPDKDGLVEILDATTATMPEVEESPLDGASVTRIRQLVRGVPASREIVELVSSLVLATQPSSKFAPERVRALVRYGSSPRGGQAILLSAKARALVKGRLHVIPEDVEALAAPALRHRIILGYEGEASGVDADELIREAFQAVS
ncbi:MAG: MoxR-like ATPase [Planctomycetota bacterium]|jgi:MoxR-like ATPase